MLLYMLSAGERENDLVINIYLNPTQKARTDFSTISPSLIGENFHCSALWLYIVRTQLIFHGLNWIYGILAI